jgi:hypothetical protein
LVNQLSNRSGFFKKLGKLTYQFTRNYQAKNRLKNPQELTPNQRKRSSCFESDQCWEAQTMTAESIGYLPNELIVA